MTTRLQQRLKRDNSLAGIVCRFLEEREGHRRFRNGGRRKLDAEGIAARTLLDLANPKLRDMQVSREALHNAITERTGLSFSVSEVGSWASWQDVVHSVREAFMARQRGPKAFEA